MDKIIIIKTVFLSFFAFVIMLIVTKLSPDYMPSVLAVIVTLVTVAMGQKPEDFEVIQQKDYDKNQKILLKNAVFDTFLNFFKSIEQSYNTTLKYEITKEFHPFFDNVNWIMSGFAIQKGPRDIYWSHCLCGKDYERTGKSNDTVVARLYSLPIGDIILRYKDNKYMLESIDKQSTFNDFNNRKLIYMYIIQKTKEMRNIRLKLPIF